MSHETSGDYYKWKVWPCIFSDMDFLAVLAGKWTFTLHPRTYQRVCSLKILLLILSTGLTFWVNFYLDFFPKILRPEGYFCRLPQKRHACLVLGQYSFFVMIWKFFQWNELTQLISHTKTTIRCCSFVGRLKRGGQKLSLERGCMKHGILLHEFGHVMGFWHEQNRPDRDEYIKVIPNFQVSVTNLSGVFE